MRIVQILPVLAFGDAVGNDTRALKDALLEAGYETEIYAAVIDERLPQGTAQPFDMLEKLEDDDIVIYHLSTGHKLNYEIEKLGGKKVILYHNITPEQYFKKYNRDASSSCAQGIKAAKRLAKIADYAIADSAYNKDDLIRYGFTCDIDVLPILIPFEDYEKKPNAGILRRYDDDYVNILFTGRVVPNKKQEDIIQAFYYYKNYINPKSRLILVGSYAGIDKYHEQLEAYVRELGLADVESMYFNVPVVARDTSAIAWTMGGSGVLLPDDDPIMAAEMVNRVLTDETLKDKILKNQRIRLQDFDNQKVKTQFLQIIDKIIQGK